MIFGFSPGLVALSRNSTWGEPCRDPGPILSLPAGGPQGAGSGVLFGSFGSSRRPFPSSSSSLGAGLPPPRVPLDGRDFHFA